MAFIEKKDPIILNIKLTTKGRNLLSQGKLNFKYFGIGDSEIDYNNINLNNVDVNILRATDKNPDIISFIGDGTTIYNPVVSRASKEYIITNTATELGFFSGNTILTDSNHVKQPSIQINIDSVSGGNFVGLYQSSTYINLSPEPEIGDILMVKWINKRGTNSNNDIISTPTPYLFYKITGKTGTLAANNIVVALDRELPNYTGNIGGSAGKIAGAMVYNNVQNTGTTLTPTAYSINSLTDFINNSQCDNIKFPLWNLSIIYSEEFAGVKSGNTKFINFKTSGLTGFISYIQEQSPIYKKLGVIHYTNSSPNNIYGEGFYHNTPVLKLPTIMWHKSNNSSIGLILSGDTIQKRLSKLDLVYYDLVDNGGNIVGKIFNELKLFVIEDQDLLFAMSFKSNRNWTLPDFSLVIGGEIPYCGYVPTTTVFVPTTTFPILMSETSISFIENQLYSIPTNTNGYKIT